MKEPTEEVKKMTPKERQKFKEKFEELKFRIQSLQERVDDIHREVVEQKLRLDVDEENEK